MQDGLDTLTSGVRTAYELSFSLRLLRALLVVLLTLCSSTRLRRGRRLQLVVDEAESRKRQLQEQVNPQSDSELRGRWGRGILPTSIVHTAVS